MHSLKSIYLLTLLLAPSAFAEAAPVHACGFSPHGYSNIWTIGPDQIKAEAAENMKQEAAQMCEGKSPSQVSPTVFEIANDHGSACADFTCQK